MSKLGKKLSDSAEAATGVVVAAGARHGRIGLAVANGVSALLFNRVVQLCDDGLDCNDPAHKHCDFKLRQR
jgi:hypothetical protein